MTDKEKIREEVERLKKRAEHNFDDISLTENERQFCLCELNVLTLIGKYIDSLQEEPVTPIWHDARKSVPENGQWILCLEEVGYPRLSNMGILTGTTKWAFVDDLMKA